MALKHFGKFLLLAFIITLVHGDEDCPHTICVGVPQGDFIDNPANCRAFFVCTNGRAIPGLCPDGFYFHPSFQTCEVHWLVPCNPQGEIELECIEEIPTDPTEPPTTETPTETTTETPTETTTETQTETTTETPTDTPTETTTEIPTETPTDPPIETTTFPPTDTPTEPPTDQTFLCQSNDVHVQQHPANCSKYILCFRGVVHIRECATGLEWDSAIEQCNVPAQAQCRPSVCPMIDDPRHPVFLYDDNHCEQFGLCVNGLPQWRSCATGFHWDRVKEWCTTPYAAGCEEWKEPPIVEIECHDDSPFRNPHPTECTMYFLCVDRESHLRHCAEGLIFDIDTLTCTLPHEGTCYADIGSTKKVSSVEVSAQRNALFDQVCHEGGDSPVREHPDTCLYFVICDHASGVAWPLPCTPGYVFVREQYACVPGNVETCVPHD